MRSVIIEGIFNSKFFDFQGYSMTDIWKRTAKSEKFKAALDVNVDPMRIVEVLEQKGTVLAFKKKGRIKSLYLIRREGNRFTCTESYYSDDIVKLPVVDLMDQKVAFTISEYAAGYKDGSAVFKDTVMPKLIRKAHGFNWSMCVTFMIIYSMIFYSALSLKGLLIGFPLGLAMGLCMRECDYHYEGHEGGKPLGNSGSSEVVSESVE